MSGSARSKRLPVLAALLIAGAGAGMLLALRPAPAVAQGIMSAPGCQCSAVTAIAGMAASVVHCLCGGTSCVISEHGGAGRNEHLMQCVK